MQNISETEQIDLDQHEKKVVTIQLAIVLLAKAGATYKQIHEEYGISQSYIITTARKWGIGGCRRIERKRKAKLKRKSSLVRYKKERRNHEIYSLYSTNQYSAQEIAQKYGISRQRVHKIYQTVALNQSVYA